VITVDYYNNESLKLSQNNPNPFSGSTTIQLYVPESTAITLEVLDIFGRTIKTLAANEVVRGQASYD